MKIDETGWHWNRDDQFGDGSFEALTSFLVMHEMIFETLQRVRRQIEGRPKSFEKTKHNAIVRISN